MYCCYCGNQSFVSARIKSSSRLVVACFVEHDILNEKEFEVRLKSARYLFDKLTLQ